MSEKIPGRDLLYYSLWCARLANECPIDAIAADLRAMSRELIAKAQEDALLQGTAA